MTQSEFLAALSMTWLLFALYGAFLAANLVEAAQEDERNRTKNGLRRIVSIGVIVRLRIGFAIMLLSVFGAVVSLLHDPGLETRIVNSFIFIVTAALMVGRMRRESWDRKKIMGYKDDETPCVEHTHRRAGD